MQFMLKRISCLTLSLVLLLGVFVKQVTAMEDSDIPEQPAAVEEPDISEPPAADEEPDIPEPPAADEEPDIPEPPTADKEPTVSEQQTTATEDGPALDEQPDPPVGPRVLVDGVVIENAAPSVYEQTTYVSLRSVAMALRPDAVVTWEGDHAAVTAEGLTIAIYPQKSYFVANGRYLYLPHGVRFESNSTLLPVRALARALDAQVQWDANDGSIYINSGTGAIIPGDQYYDADCVYWMSRIIFAESGNQPLNGKIGVGNVILNRVKSPVFPNTIYEVIFQKNQFTPSRSGSIYREPNAESVIAAKLCLDGAVVLPSALWFNRAGSSSWASRHKSCVATIGAHSFYA